MRGSWRYSWPRSLPRSRFAAMRNDPLMKPLLGIASRLGPLRCTYSPSSWQWERWPSGRKGLRFSTLHGPAHGAGSPPGYAARRQGGGDPISRPCPVRNGGQIEAASQKPDATAKNKFMLEMFGRTDSLVKPFPAAATAIGQDDQQHSGRYLGNHRRTDPKRVHQCDSFGVYKQRTTKLWHNPHSDLVIHRNSQDRRART